ncbi:MAG: nucleoside deaminase [Hyperionvirus sp.]|uniref:Nucleoside deaminase n=1 Tax=Hyperionvirus sp. TaxID=2487770 RepID=A0A3G5A8Z4_9VIRU|nr:MAG: nucleoside deaminase [Hyperionvirus sp.]
MAKNEFNETFLKRAIELSREGAIIKKAGGVFGAVIVKDGKIISEGFNQVIARNDPTWHAEIQAIREAAAVVGSPHLEGCVMYSSAACCPMCVSAAYWAHLDHIFYAATTEDALTYGNFADCDILCELKKDPKDRRLKMSEHMRSEAVKVWQEYSKLVEKKHY